MSNAGHFHKMPAAILVGEPPGERPNSYQENRYAFESSYRSCCSSCDYQGDPYECHQACGYNECENVCPDNNNGCISNCQQNL